MKHFCSKRRLLIFLVFVTGIVSVSAQEATTKEFLRAFQNADTYFYYDQNYFKAANLYEPLITTHPDNYNLAAKLGICYLNLDGKDSEALKLLKKASEGVVSSEKEYKQTGEKAPLDTYLYLAIAFHRNDSLEQALTFFNNAKKRLASTEPYQEDFIDLQIRNCRYAMEMKKRPLRIISNYFTPWLKEYPGACNPVLSKDDSVFVFTEKNEGRTQVYCSYKKNNTWERPSNITGQLGGFDRFYSNSITGDGRTLILFMDDGGDGNLYYSTRSDTVWTKIKSVGKYVNSIYWEDYGFITPDGNTMYFSSNRPGGIGGLDIWVSQRISENSWEKPVNLGDEINTPYDENTPFFDQDNNALLFSSIGHISMGAYDVFRSIKRGNSWTQPVGMPYAFNTVTENTDFILNNDAPGFIASRFDYKTNTRNIYTIVAIDPADEVTTASGTITLEDGLEVDPKITLLTVKNLNTGEIMQNIPVDADGSFHFDIKPGEYQVYVSHDGYNTDTINLSLPLYFSGKFLAVNPTLKPEKVSAGDFLSIQNVLFGFDSTEITSEALPSLELLKDILINYPELNIEVAGYTDSKGPAEYNRRLADRRAQAVINYFTSDGIDPARFVKKAFGESNFAAVNTNPDGSDNPEGRKYNRRVTFGIINPKTGVVLRQDAYTPEYLRPPSSIKYSIVLKETPEKLYPGYFSNLIRDEMLFVRTIRTDSLNRYTLGVFYNRPDAVKYLAYLKENGFEDAYIISQYDLEKNEGMTITQTNQSEVETMANKGFTIQLKATRSPINIEDIFPGYEGVREVVSDDGFYKYYYGEYNSVADAKEALLKVKKDNPDAFIREINLAELK
jgi:outer membrane protein OmpA-like peptidoglycan-associated protein/tetratricopeptide (TPR) repeat protein